MGNAEKSLVIVGAGKIAKSYLADIFGMDAGYHITFLTHRAEQARQMRQVGGYTLFKTHSDGSFDRVRISGYDAFGLDEEYEACVEVVSKAPYLALPIFPAAIEDMGVLISDAIKKRLAAGDCSALDLFICVNFLQPSGQIRAAIGKHLQTPEQQAFLAEKVGFIETLVSRLSVAPTPEMLAEDPLAATGGDEPSMPVDRDGFRRGVPEGVNLVLKDKLPVRLVHKIWTINMKHFALAVLGQRAGLSYIREATADPEIRRSVLLAEREGIYAVSEEFGVSIEEIWRDFQRQEWKMWASPTSDDALERVAQDLPRKLAKGDRVVGPALCCIRHGRMPHFLAKVLAAAYYFQNPEDPGAQAVREEVEKNGIRAALMRFSELNEDIPEEKVFLQLVEARFYEMADAEAADISY